MFDCNSSVLYIITLTLGLCTYWQDKAREKAMASKSDEGWIDLGDEQVDFGAVLVPSKGQNGEEGDMALFPDKDSEKQEEALMTLKVQFGSNDLWRNIRKISHADMSWLKKITNDQLWPSINDIFVTFQATISNDKLPWLQDVKDERVEFLVILDRSW